MAQSWPRRIALPLIAAGLLGASSLAAQENPPDNPPAQKAAPAPIPPTTTQERLVNPVGLSEPAKNGWHTDYIGPFRGIFDLSFGVKFWPDRLDLQNVIFGGSLDLLPGVRVRANFRRREGEEKFFQVDSDEIYLEAYDQYRAPTWSAGASLRIGHVRYLHFPYPDAISEFDQVPGIADLYHGPETDYRSVVLESESALNSGWGLHLGARVAGFDNNLAFRMFECYGFYRHDFGRGWHFEGRAGGIQPRMEPLGRAAQPGGDVYLGKQLGEFNVGLLYENKRQEPAYTGVMVQFRPGPVTRALGRYTFDYSRSPEGFTVQIPVLHERFNESRFVRSGDILVGEVRAVRIRTIWQQGFVRNEYEHRLESWGETASPHLHCVVVEEPWYVESEAAVSPHSIPDNAWFRDRLDGPAQFVQRVTYRYYRRNPRKDESGA